MAAKRSISRWVVPVIASATIVGGVAAAALATPQDVSFGWFAYAPLSEAAFTPDALIVLTGGAFGGLVVAAVGVVSFVFWAGYTFGASRARSHD